MKYCSHKKRVTFLINYSTFCVHKSELLPKIKELMNNYTQKFLITKYVSQHGDGQSVVVN